MVLWGAIWGGLLGFFLVSYDSGFAALVGALLGAVAGWTLRHSVRSEVQAQWSRLQSRAVLPETQAAQGAGSNQRHAEEEAEDSFFGTQSEDRQDQVDPLKPVVAPAATVSPAGTVVLAPLPPLSPPSAAVPRTATAGSEEDLWAAHELESARSADSGPDVFSHAVQAARDWIMGGNTIVRMGVLVLFVGLAFLAKYAMDNALLPPELRLAAIGATGIALFVFGLRLHQRQPDRVGYALTLEGTGVGVLYLTVFAAFRLYQFLPSGAAFVVLALVCAFSTVIALLQNALPMAFIGFAGAFAAPLLVSTGQGNHVGLFSYYLLLGVAIAVVAWWRAWRALNLLGFFATFGVATLWGVLKYQPELLATTEPFLIAFFLVYLVASLLYATRHGLHPRQAVDGTLIFGLPLVALGLQAGLVKDVAYATAFSSLALGALYLALGWWAIRRRADATLGLWLAECFAALGLGFVTLAVPLALDARWTAAVWAAEGAGVYWLGQRQGRWVARATGLALQGLAALSYLSSLDHWQGASLPFANPVFVGAVLLSLAALALARWTRPEVTPAPTDSTWDKQLTALEHAVSPVLFWVGFLWAQFGLWHEIEHGGVDADGVWQQALGVSLQSHLELLAWLGGAWLAQWWARPRTGPSWGIAATPAWFNIPIMLGFALQGIVGSDHVFQNGGWWAWPLALVLHGLTLRRLDVLSPQAWWSWVHTGGVWLVVLLLGNVLVWGVQSAQLQGTAWAAVALLIASIAVLLVLSPPVLTAVADRLGMQWPLDRFLAAYVWRAALPLVGLVALGSMVVAVHSDGNAHPLPYVPLLNPTDLSVAIALAALALWWHRVRESPLELPEGLFHPGWSQVLAGMAFVAVNTVWLRVAHQYKGVPWDAESLFASFFVQTGYSILWTVLALGLMVLAHRRAQRSLWTAGAGLLALTVGKLFLVDLSNRGGSERIVAFIAVGVMMLVVGYFAPMPPPRPPDVDLEDGDEGNT